MKYPRTYHLPFSKGTTNDDKVLHDLSSLEDKEIVVTVKMDGENTTIKRTGVHARSENSKDHVSRHWIKSLQGRLQYYIPENIALCGENLYAKHSIHYKNLLSYFYMFSTWDISHEYCMPWLHTEALALELDLTLVPTLYSGPFNLDILKDLTNITRFNGEEVEGFVVRNVDGFHKNEFKYNVVKYVRENHVQTSKHWFYQPITKNLLRS
jgi:hypothetical protein